MKIFRLALFALLLCLFFPCDRAEAFSLAVRAEPYTDILGFSFSGESLPAYSIRRTGPQQLMIVFPEGGDGALPELPKLDGASLVQSIQPHANGLLIQMKTRAFGYVSAPVPREAKLEVHIFSDIVGARWTDLSLDGLTLSSKKGAQAVKGGSKAKGAAATSKPVPALVVRSAEPLAVVDPPRSAPVALQPAAPVGELPAPVISVPVVSAPDAPAPVVSAPVAPAPDASAPIAQISAADLPAPVSGVNDETKDLAKREAFAFGQDIRPVLAAGASQITLRQSLAIALQNNPRLLAVTSRASGAELNINAARSTLLPHAQVGGSISKISNPNSTSDSDSSYINQVGKGYNLQVSQNIFDGLVRLSFYARSKLVSVRATEEKRKAELDTIEAVQKEYFKLIRVRSDIKTFQASVARLSMQRDAAQAFFRLEMAPRLTVLQVETALAQMEQRLSRTRSDEQIQLVKLNSLLGQKGEQAVDFAGDLRGYDYDLKLDFNDCLRRANQALPEVVLAKTDVEIAQEEVNISQGKAMPKVDATATYNKQYTDYKSSATSDTDRGYYTLGLNFSWEVFSGGETYYETKSKQKLLRAAQEDLAHIMLVVQALVRENYMNVIEAKNQIRIAAFRTQEAREAHEQASMRFRTGIGTTIDVLDAQEKITTAEAALSQAQTDFLTSVASLFRAMGEKDRTLTLFNQEGPQN